jgi:hypothetical protein
VEEMFLDDENVVKGIDLLEVGTTDSPATSVSYE